MRSDDLQNLLHVDVVELAAALAQASNPSAAKAIAARFGVAEVVVVSAHGLMLRCHAMMDQGVAKPKMCIQQTEEYIWELAETYRKIKQPKP